MSGGAGEVSEMRIGEVADRAGIATSRIRYYERVGLLPRAERVGGARRYGPDVLRRLAVIDAAQRAGLRLDEIRLLLEHGDHGMGDVLRELAARKVPELDALIEQAQRVRAWLLAAQACTCGSVDACVLFDDPPQAEPLRTLAPRGR